MTDTTLALLGDHEAAKRLTEKGVLLMQGDWVKTPGAPIESFEELTKYVGKYVLADLSTESQECYRVALLKRLVSIPVDGRTAVLYSGKAQRSYIREHSYIRKHGPACRELESHRRD